MSRIVSWFSRGATSAVTTKLAIAEHGDDVIVACIALSSENQDSKRFAAECENWFGIPITYLHSDTYADTWAVWEKRRYLVGVDGAPCTGELKRKVRHAWQQPDDVQFFGFHAGEPDRREHLLANEPFLNLETPLIDRGLTHDDCLSMVENVGIELPEMYQLGYSNNNCIGCPKGGMGYWNAIRVDFPETFARMAALERDIGHAVLSEEIPGQVGTRKKRPVWLDELDPERGNFERDQPRSCSLLCALAEAEIAPAEATP